MKKIEWIVFGEKFEKYSKQVKDDVACIQCLNEDAFDDPAQDVIQFLELMEKRYSNIEEYGSLDCIESMFNVKEMVRDD